MLIWIMAVLFVGGFALVGHQSGAIRSGVSFFGVILGLALSSLLGGFIAPLLIMVGIVDQVALRLLPNLFAFLIFALLFVGLGVAAHHPVELHFKYRTDEPTRQGFERMNQALGLFVGIITGICVFFSVGKYVYREGYRLVQLTSETNEAPAVRYLAQLRLDMDATGWSKAFAALDSTPAKFYEQADILGLIHANPLAHGRVENYPPFLALATAPEFAEIGADADYQKLLQEQPSVASMLNHPKTLAVLNNPELIAAFNQLDLKDFRKYIETGISPRFDDERILGRWRMDPSAVFIALKRERLNTSPAEMKKLRATLIPILSGMTLVAFPDGKFSIKVAAPPAAPVAPPAEGQVAEGGGAPPSSANAYLTRYGVRPGQTANTPAPATPRPVAIKPPSFMKAFTPMDGTWVRTEGHYALETKIEGQAMTLDALVNEFGRLTWTFRFGDQKLSVFFVRTS